MIAITGLTATINVRWYVLESCETDEPYDQTPETALAALADAAQPYGLTVAGVRMDAVEDEGPNDGPFIIASLTGDVASVRSFIDDYDAQLAEDADLV